MRFRIILLLALAAILITMTCGCSIAAGETAAADSITYDGWDWDNETVNAFTGSIDLSQWSGTEVTLELKAAFEPASESASEIVPKFTHFNGSRLTMLEQKDSFACTPEAGQAAIRFNGSLQMPEKDHYQKITIDLTAKDPAGKELKKISATVSKSGSGASQSGSIFYIPFEIRTVAIVIAAAAVLVWCLTIVRNRILNRKQEQET